MAVGGVSVCARAFLPLAVAILVLACFPARAQSPQSLPPPTYSSIDPQGVDLSSGRFNISRPGVSIGTKNNGLELSFTDLDLHDNFRGTVERRFFTTSPYSPMEYVVTLGTTSTRFLYSNGNYNLYGGDGPQTIAEGSNWSIIYTDGDGAVATYQYLPGDSSSDHWYITSLVRPDGERLTYTYVPNTIARQSIVSSLGYMIHYDYVGSGSSMRTQKITAFNLAVDYCAPTAATCAFTRTWPALTFGASGLVTFTDNLNRTTTIVPSNGQTASIQVPGGMTTAVTFGTSSANLGVNIGRVTSVSNGQSTWNYGYIWEQPGAADRTLVTTATDPLSQTQVVKSKTNSGGAFYHRNALDQVSTYELQAGAGGDGRINAVVPPQGGRVDYTYDSRGNLKKITRTPRTGTGTIVTEAVFPDTCSNPKTCNKPTYVIDERGGRTDYTYHAQGGVETITGPTGANNVRPQTRFQYEALYPWYKNADGVVAQGPYPVWRLTSTSTCATQASCAGTADETVTTITYGAAGVANNLLPTSMTTAAGDGSVSSTVTTAYDEVGNAILVDGPLPGMTDATRNYYDDARQLVGEIGPDPDGPGGQPHRARRLTYNADGQLIIGELGTATDQGASGMQSFSPAQVSVTEYDGLGRKAKELVSASGVVHSATHYAYDVLGRQICQASRMNPATLGQPSASACDPDAQGPDGPDRIDHVVYDALNRVVRLDKAWGTGAPVIDRLVSYSLGGKEETIADGNGNLTTYEYDGYERLSKVRYPNVSGAGSSVTDYEFYDYDAAGNRTNWRRRSGEAVAFNYDAQNRQLNGLRGEAYGYDNQGRRTSAAYAGGTGSATYDALGRVKSETTNGQTLTYLYDAAGRRVRITWPDGVFVTYEYDASGQMTYIRDEAGQPLAQFHYDALGRRSRVDRPNGVTTTYGYDPVSRLQSLTHDMAGSYGDQTWTYAYNAVGQVTSRVTTNGLYDWRGGQSSRPYTVNGLNQYVTVGDADTRYDTRGNLWCDAFNGSVSQCAGISYGYDLLNNLTSTSTGAVLAYEPRGRLSQVSKGGTSTTFLYSGSDLVGEYGGGLLRRYVPGPDIDDPIVWYEGGGSTDRRWLLPDAQGSIIAATNASGSPIFTNIYDEYGVPGPANQGRFQYTGQVWIPEVGLYHYKARAYSPTLGRFMQTDPTGYDDGLNWYAYVGNDPMNKRDPTGTVGCGRMSQTDCEAAMRAQSAALESLRNARAAMNAYRTAPGSKEGKAFAASFEKYFGKGSLTGKEGAKNLANFGRVMNKVEGVLRDNRNYAFVRGGNNPSALANTMSPRGPFRLNNGFFSSSPQVQKVVALHEPVHTIIGFGQDQGSWVNGVFRATATPAGAAALAEQRPIVARDNAHNYAEMIGSF